MNVRRGPSAERGGPTAHLTLHAQAKDGRIFGVPADAVPEAELDGSPVELSWGPNELTVPAGGSRLTVRVRRRRRVYGRAEQQLQLAAGQREELYYAPPVWAFLAGRFGPTPQPFPGKLGMAAVFGFYALAILAVIVALILALS